jgi:hypothetical protein
MHTPQNPLKMKKTVFNMPGGKELYGPKQSMASLYKEFVVNNKVMCFYLYKSTPESFVYNFQKERTIQPWDNNLKALLQVVE